MASGLVLSRSDAAPPRARVAVPESLGRKRRLRVRVELLVVAGAVLFYLGIGVLPAAAAALRHPGSGRSAAPNSVTLPRAPGRPQGASSSPSPTISSGLARVAAQSKVHASASPTTEPTTQPPTTKTTLSRAQTPATPPNGQSVSQSTTPSTASNPVSQAAPQPTAPPATTAATGTSSTPTSPEALGQEALSLVRYPWQQIPGYSIDFLPISDAPSPDFYGNTTFTWGAPGGVSDIYVFPGESVNELAGIIAFEIGHEVDAAGVDPAGGHQAIENLLGIHPASWAPNCDCAEQGFLSGWYAAAFSNYWSPGVGQWSTLAPMPSGAVLTEMESWFNPAIR